MPEAASLTSTSPGLGRVELDLLDAPVLADLPEDGCLGLHETPRTRVRSATTLPGPITLSSHGQRSRRTGRSAIEEELLVEEISIDGMCGVY